MAKKNKTLESKVEKHLVTQVEGLGLKIIKMEANGNKGIPDRMIILPFKVAWVELKSPTTKVKDGAQTHWANHLKDKRHIYREIRTIEGVDAFIHEIRAYLTKLKNKKITECLFAHEESNIEDAFVRNSCNNCSKRSYCYAPLRLALIERNENERTK